MTPADILVLAGASALAAASPGPSSLAIIGTSMAQGRTLGIVFALGVIAGSFTWATLALSGIGVILSAHAWAFEVLRYAGGLYLFWLSWKSARAAFRAEPVPPRAFAVETPRRAFGRGYAVQMMNPKALLFWGALFAIGATPASTAGDLALLLATPFSAGCAVFVGYAFLFSTQKVSDHYAAARRWIEAAFAAFFCFAGVRILTARLA